LGLSLEEDLGLNYQMALPNKLFDYVQARVPILCSDLPEMASLINSYEIGEVCAKRDPKEIAKQIINMLSNSKANSEWQIKLEKAATELSWEIEEEKLLKIVESAL
jgi:glycosyltransferase involved in cell wall biosynthesis